MDDTIRILILEDNPSDAELMQREIRKAEINATFRLAQDEPTFQRALDESAPDVILADYSLPGFDGLAAMSMARERNPEIPVIIVSGAIGEETAIETLKAGATDYVLKQRLARLGPVIHRALRESEELAERRRAEEAVRQAKEEWERTFNAVPDLIAILDCQHRIVRVNKAMADRLGVTPEEAIGVSCHQAVHGATAPPGFCPHVLTCLDGREHIAEVHEPNLGGDFIVSTTPLVDTQGQTVAAIHVARDITERKRAEDALADRERQLRLIMDSGPTLISYVDADLRYIRINKVYEEWFGRSSAEIEGQPVREILSESTWRSIEPYMRRALSGETVSYEQELSVRQGRTLWVNATYTPDCDESGNVRGIVVHAMDISERKHVEERLIVEKTFSESAINSMPGVFYLFDRDGKFLRWNKHLQEVTGYSADEIAGMSPLDLFDEEQRLLIARAVEQVFVHGEVKVEASFLSKDGRQTPYYFTGCLMHLDGVPYLIGAGIDITERKKAEDTLRNQVTLLQRALLPSAPPSIAGYSLAHRYIPGFQGAEIGGDFYDAFFTKDGMVGLLIGDVTGKGIPAAALAATTRSTIRAFAYESSSPSYALTHANSVLISSQMTSGKFVTVFLAILEPVTGKFRYACAGHPPVAMCHGSGSVTFLELGNLPIGVIESVEYTEDTGHLKPGGRMVLYTDGITEARHGANLFGQEGLADALGCRMPLRPDEVIDRILAAAREWSRNCLSDDTALLVIGRDAER